MYFGVITGFSTWLSALFGQVTSLRRVSMMVNDLRTFLDYPDAFLRDGGFWSEELKASPKQISFSNVCYRYEGAVCYDGTDVKKYNRDMYYELLSAVFQQFSLLPVTFAETVAEEEPSCVKRAAGNKTVS